jgi:hypothetical protein
VESNSAAPLFTLRELQPDDVSFIFNSWLKSHRDSPTVAGVPNGIYYAAHHAIIERCLKHPQARVLVACNSEDSGQIFGYVVGEQQAGATILHWLYVKHPFRGFGVARSLEGALLGTSRPETVFYTHRVKQTERLLKNRAYVYHPYLIMDLK